MSWTRSALSDLYDPFEPTLVRVALECGDIGFGLGQLIFGESWCELASTAGLTISHTGILSCDPLSKCFGQGM